ncbi:oxidoreductase [Rhodococcus erythropolis]|uniref:Oxidoreductase n=1 Tax=Rhodococcus erythropolis TaxID=1833 RepID=A0A0C2ZYH0_RHOER|nr:oxidoreductase [Rhodococcus erythropolis]KIM17505.1 oxidoreductase [Rhodococcus erythropolis]
MSDVKPLLFGVYDQVAVGGGGAASLWTHPDDRRVGANSLEYWANVARTADQANLDLLFFGDVLGLYDVYGANHEAAVRWAIEAPANDPAVLVPALAALTKNVAFAITASTTYENPFSLARRFSTIDHLSGGRFGWNIVTSYLRSAARNFGLDEMMEHDDRYERADEFMDVVYKLWEGSWADDAVVADKANAVFARGDRVRPIDHVGPNYRVAGPHVSSPSPQRTPLIFQAGWSPRGREFGAKHGEVIFAGATDPAKVNEGITDIANRAVANGRSADAIQGITGFSVIVGKTEIEVQEKYDKLQQNYHIEGQLVSYSGDIGVDLSNLADDEPISRDKNGFGNWIMRPDGSGKPLTMGDLRRRFEKVAARREAAFIGTPTQIADRIENHARISGVRGYMLLPLLSPGTLDDFVTLVVPELIKRGLFRDKPPTGTLRSRFTAFGTDRMPSESYGAQFRFPE